MSGSGSSTLGARCIGGDGDARALGCPDETRISAPGEFVIIVAWVREGSGVAFFQLSNLTNFNLLMTIISLSAA